RLAYQFGQQLVVLLLLRVLLQGREDSVECALRIGDLAVGAEEGHALGTEQLGLGRQRGGVLRVVLAEVGGRVGGADGCAVLDAALGQLGGVVAPGAPAGLTDHRVLAEHRPRRVQLVRPVVLQPAAPAYDEVGAHADRGDDRHRADDDPGLLAAAARRRRLGRHAVRRLAVGGLLRRDTGLAGLLLRIAVTGLRSLLGVAVAGLRSLRLLAVRTRLAVRPGLLGLSAVRARLVVAHLLGSPPDTYVSLTSWLRRKPFRPAGAAPFPRQRGPGRGRDPRKPMPVTGKTQPPASAPTTELPTQYAPADVEGPLYERWVERGYFEADAKSEKPPYTVVSPPPNVTGSLHLGHVFEHTLIDALTRRKRMQGHETLWQPGMDHAGIATQNVVERELAKEGKSRHDLGREAFVERVWQWKNESGGQISGQMRRLGDGV